MTIGSLFSGIGGLELGLERAGLGPVVWQAEADPFCRKVLRQHWPEAKRYRDVRFIQAGRVEPVDVICGGFPCQDISLAGSGRGLDGERSGLWREYARVVREMLPWWVVIENVTALRRRGLDVVLSDLAACGYDASWDCVPAAAVGAPHRRDRLFLVAWRVPDADGFTLRLGPERGPEGAQAADERDAEPGHVGEGVADRDGERCDQGTGAGGDRPGQPEPHDGRGGVLADSDRWRREVERVARRERAPGDESHGRDLPLWPPASGDLHAWGRVPAESQPALCGVAHGLPRRVDRLRALGNAVVPAVAEVVGRLIVEAQPCFG